LFKGKHEKEGLQTDCLEAFNQVLKVRGSCRVVLCLGIVSPRLVIVVLRRNVRRSRTITGEELSHVRGEHSTYIGTTCSKLALAAAGIGLAGFFGTNTGAFTAWAGSAALGVGDSGGLWVQHDILTYFTLSGLLTQGEKCHAVGLSLIYAQGGAILRTYSGMVVDTTFILEFTRATGV
jgi:hypothetical protein